MVMMKKLASHFIELTQDACLKAFWRRQALRSFLRQHKISESQLASWSEDESKRNYLTRLFYALVSIQDNKGYSVILAMARSLAEMKHFPDLENWEDSSDKISSAFKAVERLRAEVDTLNQQVREEAATKEIRQKAAKEREQKLSSQQNLEKLGNQLAGLIPQQGTPDGGYAFEKWFYELVAYAELSSRPPYRDPDGRQIDGSITLDGTTFLVETKFTSEQIGSSDIDIFLSKIGTKADNTMGIMVSMAGFNSGAIKTASRDRTPMLLMDYSHIYNAILPGIMTLQEVIQRIWRHAAQTGEAFLNVSNFSG